MHEWGHLRWGLQNEYPVDGEKKFYRDTDLEWTATKCGKYMKGTPIDSRHGGKCLLNRNTIQPPDTCYFEADAIDAGVEASIMFYHNVPGVSLSQV